MNMPCSRLLLTLLAYGESRGIREEIVGDLLEEIDRGRPRSWVCRQLIGLFAWASIDYLRHRGPHVTPRALAAAPAALLLTAMAVTPLGRALEVWLVVYYATGMLSLFAHMMSARWGERAGVSEAGR
jgi:hypothetical protein